MSVDVEDTHAPLTMSSREAYTLLGFGRTSWYHAMKRDELPVRPIRVGRAVRFSRAAVLALLEPTSDHAKLPDEHRVTGGAEPNDALNV